MIVIIKIDFTRASKKMLANVLIDAKWHRICITPAAIINRSQTDLFLETLVNEFRLRKKFKMFF